MKERIPFIPKILFFLFVVKPIVLLVLGLNIRGLFNLPADGPAVLAANHNSHLDTMVLMSLFPISEIHKVRPVAAADYFFKNRWLAWFSTHCIGVIALKREGFQRPNELFAGCHQALDNNDFLIIFPEGSRGRPEQLSRIKKGLFYLYEARDEELAIIPVILRGLGKTLPKGEALFVPFNCDVVIGEQLTTIDDCDNFVEQLQYSYDELSAECLTKT